MILGLDVSTSITGATLLGKDGNIIFNEAWDTRKFKDFFDKAEFVKEKIKRVQNVQHAHPGSKDLSTQVLKILLTIAKRFPGIH